MKFSNFEKREKMSAIESIRSNYSHDSDEEDVEEILNRMISNDDLIENLETKLVDAHEQRADFINNMKKYYLDSAPTSEIVRCVK